MIENVLRMSHNKQQKEKPTDFNTRKVTIAIMGAASANIVKCRLTLTLSRPSCIKNETNPNAAGAYENEIDYSNNKKIQLSKLSKFKSKPIYFMKHNSDEHDHFNVSSRC
jgi:hypothetical protein